MAGIGASASGPISSAYDGKNYNGALAVLSSLFFMWAFVTNLNDILIVQLKVALDLSNFQASLVQFAFFIAYGIMSLPSGYVLKRTGYKGGILIGLAAMLVGALLFVPAATTRYYPLFLLALFVLASGVTLLQVAANPYVAILGPPATASSRLNLTQAINSLGAALGPYIGGWLIFGAAGQALEATAAMSPEELEGLRVLKSQAVIMPYLGIAALLVLIAVMIWVSPLPRIDGELETKDEAQRPSSGSIFRYRHLVWGVVAIFFYVGAEVAIASFLIPFAGSDIGGRISESEAKIFPSIYMLLAMLGRFSGSLILKYVRPAAVVAFNSVAAVALLALALSMEGTVALYCAVGVGLFNSILFPTIFTLSIQQLGPYTKLGSSLLILGIVGGAFIPPAMGLVADSAGLQLAFLVPLLCYVYILWFGLRGSRVVV